MPENLIEQNQKPVNEIFLGTISYGHELNPDQITVLEGIACQEAITGGSAVYEAREMLRQSPDTEASCGSPRIAAANYGTSNNSFLAYPNPTIEVVIFNFNTSFGENARVELTDVNGRLVEEKKYEGQSLRIPATALKPGIYRYRITTEGMIYTGRLSVIK
jgi:hypothetical protein